MSVSEGAEAHALFTITINTMLGGAFIVEVAPSMTILSLKEMLAQIQGIPTSQQSLVYQHRVLEDELDLATAGVCAGATLTLVLKLQSALTATTSTTDVFLDEAVADALELHSLDVFDITGLDEQEREELLTALFASTSRALIVCKDGDILSFFQIQQPGVPSTGGAGAAAAEADMCEAPPVLPQRASSSPTTRDRVVSASRLRRWQENVAMEMKIANLRTRMQARRAPPPHQTHQVSPSPSPTKHTTAMSPSQRVASTTGANNMNLGASLTGKAGTVSFASTTNPTLTTTLTNTTTLNVQSPSPTHNHRLRSTASSSTLGMTPAPSPAPGRGGPLPPASTEPVSPLFSSSHLPLPQLPSPHLPSPPHPSPPHPRAPGDASQRPPSGSAPRFRRASQAVAAVATSLPTPNQQQQQQFQSHLFPVSASLPSAPSHAHTSSLHPHHPHHHNHHHSSQSSKHGCGGDGAGVSPATTSSGVCSPFVSHHVVSPDLEEAQIATPLPGTPTNNHVMDSPPNADFPLQFSILPSFIFNGPGTIPSYILDSEAASIAPQDSSAQLDEIFEALMLVTHVDPFTPRPYSATSSAHAVFSSPQPSPWPATPSPTNASLKGLASGGGVGGGAAGVCAESSLGAQSHIFHVKGHGEGGRTPTLAEARHPILPPIGTSPLAATHAPAMHNASPLDPQYSPAPPPTAGPTATRATRASMPALPPITANTSSPTLGRTPHPPTGPRPSPTTATAAAAAGVMSPTTPMNAPRPPSESAFLSPSTPLPHFPRSYPSPPSRQHASPTTERSSLVLAAGPSLVSPPTPSVTQPREPSTSTSTSPQPTQHAMQIAPTVTTAASSVNSSFFSPSPTNGIGQTPAASTQPVVLSPFSSPSPPLPFTPTATAYVSTVTDVSSAMARLPNASRRPSRPASRGASASIVTRAPSRQRERCAVCSKKLKVAATYTCRCGGQFCPQHRYAETHCCTFDYKGEGRRALAAASPAVCAPKLPKI
eukprot:m.30691 g.30691  ORF g.30691 m.30691 type:complete len:994 (-) comp9260_c0_seq1:4-2985(-)